MPRRGALCALRAPLGHNDSLGPFQLISEKKPRFRSGNETLPMAVVSVRLCQFLFGLRSALGRCKHDTSPSNPTTALS